MLTKILFPIYTLAALVVVADANLVKLCRVADSTYCCLTTTSGCTAKGSTSTSDLSYETLGSKIYGKMSDPWGNSYKILLMPEHDSFYRGEWSSHRPDCTGFAYEVFTYNVSAAFGTDF